MTRILPDWRLRFFLVGEYGDEEQRPHFHAALFGYRGCEFGDWFVYSGQNRKECKCVSCGIIRKTWGKGRIHQGVVERKSAQYLAGYTVKGMTDGRDKRLRGREPEFARMSLRPGIGANSIGRIADALARYEAGVPGGLRHGERVLPLGRYLREKIYETRPNAEIEKVKCLEDWKKELQALREAAKALSDKKVYVEGTYDHEIFRRLLVEQDMEKVRQLEARRKLYERGKK